MRVFVYGTLTDPDRVAALLADGPGEYAFAGPATLEGLRRVDGTYPTLVPGGSVEGTLLSVDEAGLDRLDAYEGVDRGLYVRVRVPLSASGTRPEEGESDEAWVYVGDPERLGVDAPDGWPGSGSFAERVERLLDRERIVITPRE